MTGAPAAPACMTCKKSRLRCSCLSRLVALEDDAFGVRLGKVDCDSGCGDSGASRNVEFEVVDLDGDDVGRRELPVPGIDRPVGRVGSLHQVCVGQRVRVLNNGDVQVQDDSGTWLWTEVKQKVVTTGDVQGFIRKVHEAGGERVVYFALVNSGYSANIQPKALENEARKLGMGVQLLDSPAKALEHFLPLASGSYAGLSGRLLERTHARMTQAGCSPDVLGAFTVMAVGAGAQLS